VRERKQEHGRQSTRDDHAEARHLRVGTQQSEPLVLLPNTAQSTGLAMGWLCLVGSINYRSFLLKSPITETISCKRDYNLIDPTDRSHSIPLSTYIHLYPPISTYKTHCEWQQHEDTSFRGISESTCVLTQIHVSRTHDMISCCC